MKPAAKTFVVRSPEIAKQLVAYVKDHAAEMIAAGTPLACRVYPWHPPATDAQRALIWVIVGQIAAHYRPGGKSFSPEAIHEYAKRELLPEETASGVQKWKILPDDSRVLVMSTEQLNRDEKKAYIDALLAWAATELGVEISIEQAA